MSERDEKTKPDDLFQMIDDAIAKCHDMYEVFTKKGANIEILLVRIRKEAESMKRTLNDTVERATKVSGRLANARNELCLKCGRYNEAHEGACDGCVWKDEWRVV